MINKTLKRTLLCLASLLCLTAGAQEYDSELQLSDEETVCWYRICNAAPGMDVYAMTDLNSALDGEGHDDLWRSSIYLMPTEAEDYHSQWKLTAADDGKVLLTNRATGLAIGNRSASIGNINVTMLASRGGAQGFTITALGDNAFSLQSIEDDGVNRCLALAEKDGDAISYPETGASTSVIGWKFFPVEIETSIGSIDAGRPLIQVKNRRISVKGCPVWQLYNVEGEEMPCTVSLPAGIYMVKMPQKSLKVLVQ